MQITMVDNSTTTTTLQNATLVLPRPTKDTLVAQTALKPMGIGMEKSISNSSKLPKTILARMFSEIYIGHFRFLVMDCPTATTLDGYLKELKIRGVTDVVRLCNPTYDKQLLLNDGIQVHDCAFVDGGVPPPQILSDYLSLCEQRFHSISLTKDQIQSRKIDIIDSPPVIAIHCVAGLGRAPLMVAICLIEAGFAPMDAVDFIRKCRRGAFNATQLKYLIDDYKKRTVKSSFGFLKRAVTPPKETDEKGFSFKGFFKIKK